MLATSLRALTLLVRLGALPLNQWTASPQEEDVLGHPGKRPSARDPRCDQRAGAPADSGEAETGPAFGATHRSLAWHQGRIDDVVALSLQDLNLDGPATTARITEMIINCKVS